MNDGDGSPFVGESVRDTYGGSWLVSERGDGSRLILDFARREVTEVRPAQGTYWTMTFDAIGALGERLRAAQRSAEQRSADEQTAALPPRGQALRTETGEQEGEIVVTEVRESASSAAALGSVSPQLSPLGRVGVRHLRILRRGDRQEAAVDAWVDPSLRLSAAGALALAAFEDQVANAHLLAAGKDDPANAGGQSSGTALTPSRCLAAARTFAGGAFVLRTLRPLLGASGSRLGTFEDTVTRVDRLERFPAELARIPEGLRRVVHPGEASARFLEDDRARDAAMSGRGAATPPGSEDRR